MLSKVKSVASYIWERIARYAVKFGVVGIIGFFINVALFNLLRIGAFGHDHFFQGALGANIISVTVSIIFNWIGNRYWTFREHRRQNFILELFEYSVVSVGGMFFQLGCLYLSHYVFGWTSLLADNISSNIVGLGLGTVFRFVLYRYWVYGHHRKDGLTARRNQAEAAALSIFENDVEATKDAEDLGPEYEELVEDTQATARDGS